LTSEVRDFAAQQGVFDANPNEPLLALGADAALAYFRWVPARRIEAEGNTARAAQRPRP
jgi:vanillate O-demethylase monooxygenase subunit